MPDVGCLLIRADASPQIGTGHVMRCLALAQAWQESGGTTLFALANGTSTLEVRLLSEGMKICHLTALPGSADDAAQTIKLARELKAAWVVIDGYHFSAAYQHAIKQAGLRLLFIDDYGHTKYYYADLVLNQNISADESLYANRESHTRLLLGTRYALLRREFWPWRGWRRKSSPVARKVLVTMGGSDPENVTLKAMQALQNLKGDELETVVVVGSGNLYAGTLQSNIRNRQTCLVSNISNMAELMAWADLAISAGGSTCWELAFMGLPSIILVLADNQRLIAKQLSALGWAVNLGWHHDISSAQVLQALTSLLVAPEKRVEMIRRGQEIVDGDGTTRLLMHLRGKRLRLRMAGEDDCKLLWEWANDRAVRQSAFSSDPIAWENHVEWFSRKLFDPKCFLFVALDDKDTPVGQIRFDIDGDQAEVDVSVDESKRGLGYGGLLISIGVEELLRVTSVQTVNAFIKLNNVVSIKAFERAKFKNLGVEIVRGNMAIHYAWFRTLSDEELDISHPH